MTLFRKENPKYRRGRNTHKQNLAGEYNFMIFRAEGSYLGGHYKRNIPPELQEAFADAYRSYTNLRRLLRLEKTRKDFMAMNLKKEEKK